MRFFPLILVKHKELCYNYFFNSCHRRKPNVIKLKTIFFTLNEKKAKFFQFLRAKLALQIIEEKQKGNNRCYLLVDLNAGE
jgi:hypothetical protein